MSWPNPNEYIEAIQSPQQAFSDPELRPAKVATNRFGLPRPISGNFATVFEVQTGRGRSAVRCFLREVTNQQERYAAVAAHLRQHALPFMVDFEYQPEGIRVRGRWYPILKMDWADGIRLDTYIEAHLNDSSRLRHLAESWIAVCRSLREARIAHGDLQHGNVQVSEDGVITLLDYDDMIVPDVVGFSSREIGHRHYQHPSRKDEHTITRNNFVQIDNFSSRVIGVSLMALALDPSLWEKTKAGDENLLFRDVDFVKPETSVSFQLLAEHSSPQVRALGHDMLAAAQARSYLEVEALALNPLESPLTRSRNWLVSQMLERFAPPVPEAPPLSSAPADSWVFDHLAHEPPAQVGFSDQFLTLERLKLEVQFDRSFLKSMRAAFYPYLIWMLFRRFPTYPAVIEKEQQAQGQRDLEDHLQAAVAHRKMLSRLIVEADRRWQQEVAALEQIAAQVSGEMEYSLRKEARDRARIERILYEQTQAANGQNATNIQAAGDWDDLARWRASLEQSDVSDEVVSISAEDIRLTADRYSDAHLTLAARQQAVARQLAALQTDSDSLALVNSLRLALEENEQEISAIKQRQAHASDDLRRYQDITRFRLIALMLRLLLVETLRAAA